MRSCDYICEREAAPMPKSICTLDRRDIVFHSLRCNVLLWSKQQPLTLNWIHPRLKQLFQIMLMKYWALIKTFSLKFNHNKSISLQLYRTCSYSVERGKDCSYCSEIFNIYQWKAYLFSFQIMYKTQFKQIDPHDWFCGPGSHIYFNK